MRYLLCLLCCAVMAMAAPLATFSAKEYLGLEWPRMLVTYPLAFKQGQAREGRVRLVDETGTEQICQLSRVIRYRDRSIRTARLSFYTALAKNGSFRYDLLAEKPAAAEVLPAERLPIRLVLATNQVEARLPAAGVVSFATPVSLMDASRVAPPLQGVSLPDGTWVGNTLFTTKAGIDVQVTGYTCMLLENGPLFSEARVRYQFTNGGFYQLTARVEAENPALIIDEQADLKTHGDEYAVGIAFHLNNGRWKPDTIYWRTNEGRLSGKLPAFETAAQQTGFNTKAYAGPNYGSRTLTFTDPLTPVCDVAVWYPWNPNAYFFGLIASAQFARDGRKAPFVGVIPMHAGTWRGAVGASNGKVVTTAAGDVILQWPLITARHPNSLLHTGEYDPVLPLTYLRRQWALVSGPVQYYDALETFRCYQGYINLDEYKDWRLDWPVDPKVTYPRLVFSKADVERLKPVLDAQPGKETLKKFLYFTDDEARFKQLYGGLVYNSCWSGPLGVAVHGLRNEGWISSFRYTQMCGWAGNADEVLSSARLTEEQRAALRAYLAAACYVMSSPDFNPRGAMVHLGNPNMPINRFLGLTFAAALIPDHPRAKDWLDVSAEYTRYKLAMNTAPGGGWSELLTYYGASAPHLMQASAVLQASGRMTDSLAELAALPGSFPLYLLTPKDPRFGARMLPCWGHEGMNMLTQWLPTAGIVRDRNPALASALAWAWNEGGQPMEEHHDAGFSERCVLHADLLKPGIPPEMASRWIPGIGVVLRSHVGDPNETFFTYRQGYMVSHCDNNQGDFVLYSKGAPLVTLSLFGYPLHQNQPYIDLTDQFGWHSQVRFGTRTNKSGGWNDTSEVHAYSFNDSTDYLRGGVTYGSTAWTRQIVFLKGNKASGPNYFLFRDSFAQHDGSAAAPTFWSIRHPEKATAVTPNSHGLQYVSPYGTTLDVRFLQEAPVTVETRQASRRGEVYNRGAINWQKAGSPVASGKGGSIQVDETLTVASVGPFAAGHDIVAALYPQAKGEALPAYTTLADGVVKVATSEGTDYVFMHRTPITFAQGEMAFKGLAGAVRVYPDEVHLVIAEGPAEVTYNGVTLKSAIPAVKVLPLAGWKAQTIEVPVAKTDIACVPSMQVPVTRIAPGVVKETVSVGVVYYFDSPDPISFEQDGVHFSGRKGAVAIHKDGAVTLTMMTGESIGYQDLRAWGCDGPYELTFTSDKVTGRYSGQGRFLNVTQPKGLDRLPMYILDGQTYAPGTSGTTAILPLMPGEHRFELRALPQPPIWRNWQQWE
jgi:hypothetical protein